MGTLHPSLHFGRNPGRELFPYPRGEFKYSSTRTAIEVGSRLGIAGILANSRPDIWCSALSATQAVVDGGPYDRFPGSDQPRTRRAADFRVRRSVTAPRVVSSCQECTRRLLVAGGAGVIAVGILRMSWAGSAMPEADGPARHHEQGTRRRPSVDRDALLHRYTVALARRWPVPRLTWAYERQGVSFPSPYPRSTPDATPDAAGYAPASPRNASGTVHGAPGSV